jgi:DNA-binding NtrC family response regulator
MTIAGPQLFSVTGDRDLATRWREACAPLGGSHTAVDGLVTAFRLLPETAYDIVLIDPAETGLPFGQLLSKLRLRAPGADLLVATGEPDQENATTLDRWGVTCRLPRDLDAGELTARIKSLLSDRERVARCGWIGITKPIRAASDLILAAANSETTVLIEGESGTGKELAARAVHQNSPRADKPFLALNCSAFTETLLESELFGHEKGAFTDAFARKQGVFEAVAGGTIFLDEIGETLPGVQTRLLRVLEEKQVRPVGAAKSIPVDFRVVAATNRNLLTDSGGVTFRHDLYYRLAVIQLTLPPLRDRQGDIPALLAHHFTSADTPSAMIDRVDENTLARLVDHDWPGNVRELRNFVERVNVRHPNAAIPAEAMSDLLQTVRTPMLLPVVTGRRTETVEREMIFAALSELKHDLDYLKRRIDRIAGVTPGNSHSTTHEEVRSMKQVERDQIIRALTETHGNRAKAARILGIGERTLYRKIREFGL